MQQCLPFTVLKRTQKLLVLQILLHRVATVLTVYGIETRQKSLAYRRLFLVATVLTVYGIETQP